MALEIFMAASDVGRMRAVVESVKTLRACLKTARWGHRACRLIGAANETSRTQTKCSCS